MEGISLGSAYLRLYGDRSALDRELEKLKRYTDLLEKQGIKVKFDADTGRATREVDALQNRLSGLNGMLQQVGQGLRGGGWDDLAKTLGGLKGQAAAGAGAMGQMGGALGGAAAMAGKALPMLGQLGMAAMGLQAIFTGVSGAVNSVLQPLQNLAREAGRFNQQVAEGSIFTAQSFAVLGPDGKAIEGTANQMRALRSTIAKEYKEIQKEVAQISGATASEIYEGFNLILQNSSALGKDGENLSKVRKLSTRLAAGMNTLGIPGAQLRSEVSSLMTGDIQMYDQLPKKLGYDRATVERLKAEGRFYDDLMQKLEKLYDGQKVLSASLSNVQSNFADVFQTIASEGAQALERGLAGAFKAVLTPLDQLQGSFTGLLRGFSEALEPIQKMLGELGGWLVSISAMVASVGQVIVDVLSVINNLVAAALMPVLEGVGGTLTVIAKGFELIAAVVSSLLRPLSVFLRVFSQQNSQQTDGFFEKIIGFFDELIRYAEAAAEMVAKPFVALAQGQAWVQGKLTGQSDKAIAQRQSEIQAEFDKSLGGGDAPDIRSLKLNESTTKLLEERAARYGNSESAKQLAIQKEISQLVGDRVKNEIQALDQGLKLMQAQKSVQEALSQLNDGRRGLDMSRAGFSVQLAASPEARLAAEERRNDLQQQQEQTRINERRALLGTEREMLQTQLKIQLRQQQLQQEQLKIQRLELQIQRNKAENAARDIVSRMQVLNPSSQEYQSLKRQWVEVGKELKLREDQLKIVNRTVQLGEQQTQTIRKTNALEAQRLDIQGEQLVVQTDMANLNREQQATMARIQREEQRITNELEARSQEVTRQITAGETQIKQLQEQQKLDERLLKNDQARLELMKAQADAAVQTAEQELRVAQAQQDATQNPTSVRAVVGAQIEALAAGAAGLVNEAAATRQLYAAKERQLQLEQDTQRAQLLAQQQRELSELRIHQLNLKRIQLEQNLNQLKLNAEADRLRLQQQRDAMSGGGGSGSPTAAAAVVDGGIANMLPGTRGGPYWNDGVGYIPRRGRNHNGQDLGLDVGDPIHARRAGKVVDAYSSGFGTVGGAVVVRYDDGSQGTYGHVNPGVRAGQAVAAGQRIATVTPDGQNTHLHYELRNGFGKLLNPLNAIKDSLRVAAGQVAGGGLPAPASANATPSSGIAPSVENALTANATALKDSADLQAQTNQELNDLATNQFPNLMRLFAMQRTTLDRNQMSQQQALQVEGNRSILTAEVLNSTRGRLAGQLTEAVVGGLSGTVRGIFAQMRNGRFDLSSLSEEITLAMTERITGALLDSFMAPIERQLTGNLFKTISGVDVEAAARELTARQESAAAEQQRAAAMQVRAAEMRGQGVLDGAAAQASTVAGGTPANGVVPLQVQPFTGADPTAPVGQELQQATENLSAWNTQLPYLQQYTGALTESSALVQQNLQTVASKAAQASTGFDGLMQGIGGAISTLGSIAMAAGAAQQMGKGGTYNTLMGLAGIFGAVSSVAGGLSSLGGMFGGGAASLGTKAQGVNFNPKAFNMPKLVDAPIPSFAGGGYTGAGAMAGGMDGRGGFMAMLHPNESVVPGNAYAATAAALEGGAGAVSRPLNSEPIRLETRVINGIEYATVEQLQQATRQAEVRGAERGRAMTLNSMRNSVKTRRQVGV